MPRVPAAALRRLAAQTLEKMGCATPEAEIVAKHLVRANLTGHDSHGIGVLPGYVGFWRKGQIIANQTLRPLVDQGALLLFDGARGFGHHMAEQAVRAAIVRARELGACVVGLRSSAHVGRIGGYAEIAAAEGMAFVAFVNVADFIYCLAPWGSREARLGTNPFCAAIPNADGEPAMMLDCATTTIAYNKARVAYNLDHPVPEGTLLDKDGNATTDPTQLIRDGLGALTPFGKHKGSGLAVMCEALGAVLTGGQRGDEPQHASIMNSMLAIVIDVSRFADAAVLAVGLNAVAASIRSASTAPGFDEILLPGEPERRKAADLDVRGILVPDPEWKTLLGQARELGVDGAVVDEIAATATPATP
jgi:hydroxycarboxylate dehydrogenase B